MSSGSPINKKGTAIIITGPTASGKSALAISLARKLDTEIVSADSRQIYKGIPIVTAVPALEEREGVTHHLMEKLPLDSYYSASEFESDAIDIIGQLLTEKEYVIVCGGSMMYIDTLRFGIDDLPTVPQTIRQKMMDEWRDKGDEWLVNELKRIDSDYYTKVDLKNLKRVFHAVEVTVAAGRPYSSLLGKQRKERPFNIMTFCLEGERQQLFERINRRVVKMIANGLEEEARSVYPLRGLNSLNTVGLKEMFTYFEGGFTKEEAISRIQKNTRVYAKKQMTWFNRDRDIIRLNLEAGDEKNCKRILDRLQL